MTVTADLGAAKLRERIGHPIIDGDGHTLEYMPALESYMAREGWTGGMTALRALPSSPSRRVDERFQRRTAYMSPLTRPYANTYDLATATLPGLLYSRLDELGIDFAVVYPTMGQVLTMVAEEEPRRLTCRAENNYMADVFGDYADRLCPVAVIPMYTPDEAIDELEFAVTQRGFRAVMIGANAQRPTPGVSPELLRETGWLDTFGIDSEYDYDPFWAKCAEYGIAPAAHSIGMGWGSRRSPSNYVYNQIGHFAATGEALAKSLFLGGVTQRFPSLRFAFLEGGVGWACTVYADFVNRWEKRNPSSIRLYDRRNIDEPLYEQLLRDYGPAFFALDNPGLGLGEPTDIVEDDFARCGIERAEDIRDLFAARFYFGCEADDPSVKFAFDRSFNPFDTQLNAVFSSDIGHWDVPDMRNVIREAYEHVEHGRLDESQFRDFTYENVMRFYTAGNPRFFEGTVVSSKVEEALSDD
jgi:predicted TIM-barrel fold metal-dependent hydrolase